MLDRCTWPAVNLDSWVIVAVNKGLARDMRALTLICNNRSQTFEDYIHCMHSIMACQCGKDS